MWIYGHLPISCLDDLTFVATMPIRSGSFGDGHIWMSYSIRLSVLEGFGQVVSEKKDFVDSRTHTHTYIHTYIRDGSKSFFASPSQVTSHFLASPSQVTSHLVRRQVKSSHKSFGPNTSQVTSLFVQVQVKSHIISSTPIIRRGIQ